MNKLKKRLSLVLIATSVSFTASQAQVVIDWVGDGEDNLWSNALNWSDGNVPDTSSVRARFNLGGDVLINIDQDFTINRYIDGGAGEGNTHSLYGEGILTIDANNTVVGESIGIDNATVGDGGTFRIGNGNIVIQNSQGTATTMRNLNSSSNRILFDTGSSLTINTLFRTVAGSGGRIDFNGVFAPSSANFQIGSGNVYFGEGHNSANFGADIVMLGNSKLTITGGTVLSPGQKFQLNGNGEIGLHSENSINGAFIVLGGGNNLYLDVNANQENIGYIHINNGQLTIDVDAAVSNVSFGNSYFQNWGSGSVVVTGFKEETIRFGTHGAGLRASQLAVMGGGIYSLTDDGYLTEESISRWARFAIDAEGFASLSPWLNLTAFVETAPFIGTEEAGWLYITEAVAVQGNGWIYAYDLEAMEIDFTANPSYGYSLTLKRWVYAPSEAGGWIQVL